MRPTNSVSDSSGRTTKDAGAPTRDAGSVAPASADAFAVALRTAIATGATDTEPLRLALLTFVTDMRLRAEAPERTLIAVKERVLLATQRRPDLTRTEAGALLRQIVHWTIEAYYRAD
jgi:hypothetical protein